MIGTFHPSIHQITHKINTYEVDKIKIFTPIRDAISEDTIHQRGFKEVGETTKTVWGTDKKFRLTTYSNIETNITYSPVGTTVTVNPTKWLLDSNTTQITYTQLCEFVPLFIEYMAIRNEDFHLTGIDYNQDITTDYPPSAYLPIFGNKNLYNKTTYFKGTGVHYQTNKRSRDLIIYDKVAEMKHRGQYIPPTLQNQNRLRIEYAINKNYPNTKLRGIKTLNDLTNPDSYRLIANEWLRSYTSINKRPRITQIKKPDQMKIEDFAILNLINQIGIDEYYNIIDSDHHKGLYSRQAAYKKKDKARALVYQYTQTTDMETLLEELDRKVQEQYQMLLHCF